MTYLVALTTSEFGALITDFFHPARQKNLKHNKNLSPEADFFFQTKSFFGTNLFTHSIRLRNTMDGKRRKCEEADSAEGNVDVLQRLAALTKELEETRIALQG